MFLITTTGLVVSGLPAQALTDEFIAGYVNDEVPAFAGCHFPFSGLSYNSRNGVNTICRTGTGAYTVHFPGLGVSGGNVQVTANDSIPGSCKVVSWSKSGSEEQVKVKCVSFGGSAQDTGFTASFRGPGGPGLDSFAYLRANSPKSSSYTPSSTYQFNSTGSGLAKIKRSSKGAYTVSIPFQGGASATGSVKVTAYGSSSGVCKVVFWGPGSPTIETVAVQCYNHGGSPSDEQFTLAYMTRHNFVGDYFLANMYAWADNPVAASYTPDLAYQWDTNATQTGTVSISRQGVGTYDVFMPFQDNALDEGNVQVTAYGGTSDRCQVDTWGFVPGGRSARVLCFTNSGVPDDTFYTVQYVARLFF
jgi:hypothetical protein